MPGVATAYGRTPCAFERPFYHRQVNRHPIKADRIAIAWLAGAVSRHAGWVWPGPTGPAREAALAELREIATKDRRLRTELLAEEAGIRLGFADVKGPPSGLHDAICAELLLEAGAGPEELVEEWRGEGARRAGRRGAPFSGEPRRR